MVTHAVEYGAEHTMMGQRGSEKQLCSFGELGASWKWAVDAMPGRFTLWKIDHCTGNVWGPRPVCTGAKSLSSGFYSRTVQLVASHYAD